MKLKSIQKKVLATLAFAIIASIGLIIHGIFFDLAFDQIKRLSFGGFLLTFVLVFPTLLLLEWIFDLENHEEFVKLDKRIKKLEKRSK